MKKLLLIPVLLFVVFTKTFAQDCKWDENKKDPISNAKYLKSKLTGNIKGEPPAPNVRTYFKSYIELKDGKVSIFIIYTLSNMLSLEKIQNPEIIIKTADETKIDIKSEEQFSTTLNGFTEANLKWNIAPNDLKKLAASKITAIRISFAGQDYSYIVEDKAAQQFLSMFSCMSKEL